MINRAVASPVTRYALLGLTVLSLAGISWSLYTVLANQTRISWQMTLQVTAERYTSALKDVETGQRGYTIAGNEDFLAPYYQAKAVLDGYTAALAEAAVNAGLPDEILPRMIAQGQTVLKFAETAIAARKRSFAEAQA